MDARCHTEPLQCLRTHLLETFAFPIQTGCSAEKFLFLDLVGQLDVGQDQDELLKSKSGHLKVLDGVVVKFPAQFLLSHALVEGNGRGFNT